MGKTLVIIPAYNEEANIGGVIKKVSKVLKDAEIIVVNDGSNDKTAEIAQRAGVTVISHPYNLGYGVSLQTGYKYALSQNIDYLIQLDGDGQHDPSFIPDLLEPVRRGKADVVLGSRFLRHSYKAPFFRRLGILIFAKLISAIINQEVTDPTSGFQALDKEVVKFYASNIYPTDFPDADVIIADYFAGFKIKEVPVKMYPSPTGKSMHSGLKPLYYLFKMFLSIFITLIRKKERVARKR